MGIVLAMAILLLSLGLQGCGSDRTSVGSKETASVIGSEPEGSGFVSAEFYQPTNHALVVIGGGGKEPLTTEWQRSGSNSRFSVVLTPGRFETIGLNPGRYLLMSANSGENRYDFAGEGEKMVSLEVEPGDVIDAGILYVQKHGDQVVAQIKDDPGGAQAAIQQRYPLQASSMKSKPLQVMQ